MLGGAWAADADPKRQRETREVNVFFETVVAEIRDVVYDRSFAWSGYYYSLLKTTDAVRHYRHSNVVCGCGHITQNNRISEIRIVILLNDEM